MCAAGDVLAVWKFDRLGRSLPHLIETVTDLNARRIGLRSLTENIDTTTPGGRLIFHVFGALAAFERDLVKERTMAGLAAAAARGRQGGRRPVVTPCKLERARAMLAQGLNVGSASLSVHVRAFHSGNSIEIARQIGSAPKFLALNLSQGAFSLNPAVFSEC